MRVDDAHPPGPVTGTTAAAVNDSGPPGPATDITVPMIAAVDVRLWVISRPCRGRTAETWRSPPR
jgi:hypothetical protein